MSEREYTTEELVAWLKQDAQFSEEHARLKYAVHPSVLGVALSECARTKAAAAEIDRLTAALASAPVREERAGRCWCEDGEPFAWGWPCVCDPDVCDTDDDCGDFIGGECKGPDRSKPRQWYSSKWLDLDGHDMVVGPRCCFGCGAHLGADGMARRWTERGE